VKCCGPGREDALARCAAPQLDDLQRVPRRVSPWLPQCGHASGILEACGARAIRGTGRIIIVCT
jgi:hypothetical protein